MNRVDESRIHALIARLCDAELTVSEAEELSQLLNHDPQAIQEYVDLTAIEFHLHRKMWVPLQTSVVSEHQLHQILSASEQSNSPDPRNSILFRHRKSLFLAIAASLVIACGLLLQSYRVDSVFVARITDQIDCSWGESRWGKPHLSDLQEGRVVEFELGLMSVEFGRGAEVVLEGPVRFEVLDNNRGYLKYGKLTANVPRQATGFSIEMPLAEAIDLGTRFGAYVSSQGDCEAHVFEGKVVVQSRRHGDSQKWQLGATQALRISEQELEPQQFAAQPEAFSDPTSLIEVAQTNVSPELSIPANRGLTLWLEASQRIQVDSKGQVNCWGDICQGDNTVADNAWQVDVNSRPQWIPNTIADRSTVRFNGSSCLVTSPFASGEDITVICVFRGQPQNIPSRRAGQVINFNGPPTLILEQSWANQFLGGVSSTGLDPVQNLSGRLEASLPRNVQPVVCGYTYSSTSNRSALYLNGELIGKSPAPVSSAIFSTKFIGKGNAPYNDFVGDIYEIMLFNTELSSEECIHISSELMVKYEIKEKEREPRVLSGLVPEDE